MTDTAERSRDVSAALDGPIPVLFCVAGAGLTIIGCVPWIATLAGADTGTTWAIRIIAGLAVVVGIFIVLVGIGLVRARNAMHAAAAEAALDEQLLAAAASAKANPAASATANPAASATANPAASAKANPAASASASAFADPDVTHDACAPETACATCDASCALSALR